MRVYTDWKEMEERTPVIRFRNADIFNGENCVIYGLDMDVYPGDFIYIVGKVGTGKTSIIRTIIAENPLVKGEGTVCGYDITSIRPKDIPFLRRRLGVVFQDFQLLMDRSVEENLAFVLKATGWKEGAEFYSRIDEVLAAVGMNWSGGKSFTPIGLFWLLCTLVFYSLADITETEAELRAQVTAQICAEREAERAIFALEDPLEREVLRMRYLNGWMMTKVAQKLNYSERQVYRLQESGLQHLEKSWPKAGQGSPAAPATAPSGAACP